MQNLVRTLPPLRSLLAFEAAARLGSFTRAARELQVSQPAISRQVRMLEDDLKITLFRREHRKVILTEAGQHYYEAVVTGFDLIATTGRQLSGAETAKTITLYANYGLAAYWLMPKLETLQGAQPDLSLAVQTLEDQKTLSDQEPEIAIRFGNGKWKDGEARLLFGERCFAVCSPDYLERSAPLTSAQDLLQHRLLHVASGTQQWMSWENFLKHCGVEGGQPKVLWFNNYTLALQAALAGQGIAIGWQNIVDEFLERGWLVAPVPDEIETGSGYYSVVNRDVWESEDLESVISWLHG
ncbi:LysR substrate-binding domain-containing protein [Kiloniella sp. b19]|uniref:LysR substrate-binding domain-containing protein n=1 Tax=Kiloniella sp. GXU_MW_B19 TaxID=3141326 RepID=UPI0031D86A40